MAEAASIIGILSFCVDVSKDLYDASDRMRNARTQIRSIAKSVNILSDTLRHVRDALESQRGAYTEELEHSVQSICASSREIVGKIRSTLYSKSHTLLCEEYSMSDGCSSKPGPGASSQPRGTQSKLIASLTAHRAVGCPC